MKKIIIISFLCLCYSFSFSQARILNGQYNDGAFGKIVHDTVRTLVAGTNVTITSGGASLVDTISASGGGSSSLTATYVGYGDGSNALTGSSNFRYDATNQRLAIGGVAPSNDIEVNKSNNGVVRIASYNTSTGGSAQANMMVSNGTYSSQLKQLGTNFTTSGLLHANESLLYGGGTDFLIQAVNGASDKPHIIFGVGNSGNTEAMRIFYGGQVSINAPTDSSYYLNVNGGIHAYASSVVNTLERTTAVTNYPVSAMFLKATSSGTMADNFGPSFTFEIQGSADTANAIGSVQAVRDGADNSGDILFNSYSSGTHIEGLRIKSSGNVEIPNKMYIGDNSTTPTAYLMLKAGTATANTAPLKFTSGTILSTPELGAMEYNGTNLYFTNNTSRYSILMSGDPNVVSPTAPNRTISVVINGTTYYIAAKTTND